MDVALITVVHDPNGNILSLFQQFKEELDTIYSKVYITISDETSHDFRSALEESDFQTKIIPKKGAAHARRQVVQFGLDGSHEHYHYCDFDRILTWVKADNDELRQVVKEIPESEFLVLGRTEKAFETHPREWIETERITNKIFSLEIGRNMDITAGSCAFTKECAEYITRYSEAAMTDAEWPMIAWRVAGKEVETRRLDGLRYLEELNSINQDITEAERWLSRLRLSYIISETALKTGEIHGGERGQN